MFHLASNCNVINDVAAFYIYNVVVSSINLSHSRTNILLLCNKCCRTTLPHQERQSRFMVVYLAHERKLLSKMSSYSQSHKFKTQIRKNIQQDDILYCNHCRCDCDRQYSESNQCLQKCKGMFHIYLCEPCVKSLSLSYLSPHEFYSGL